MTEGMCLHGCGRRAATGENLCEECRDRMFAQYSTRHRATGATRRGLSATSSRSTEAGPPEWWKRLLPKLDKDPERPGVLGWDEGTWCRLAGWENQYAILEHDDDAQRERYSWLIMKDTEGHWSPETWESEEEARRAAREDEQQAREAQKPERV